MIILKSSFLLNRNFQWLHNIFFYVNANDRYHRFYKNNSVFNARHTALILQQYYTQLYLCMLFGFIICAIENIIFNFNILMRSIYLLKMIVNIKWKAIVHMEGNIYSTSKLDRIYWEKLTFSIATIQSFH